MKVKKNLNRIIALSVSLSLLILLGGALQASDNLAIIRAATSKYHQLQVALDEGFQPVFACIDHATEGAMGYHYGLFSRFDAQLVLDQPEVLVYAPDGQGHQKLAAVEYIIPAAAWTAAEPPTFLGKTLQLKNTVGPHVVDPYWELHVWVWRNNPTDIFADWNPKVSCAHEH
jgi:hypothetical protein